MEGRKEFTLFWRSIHYFLWHLPWSIYILYYDSINLWECRCIKQGMLLWKEFHPILLPNKSFHTQNNCYDKVQIFWDALVNGVSDEWSWVGMISELMLVQTLELGYFFPIFYSNFFSNVVFQHVQFIQKILKM